MPNHYATPKRIELLQKIRVDVSDHEPDPFCLTGSFLWSGEGPAVEIVGGGSGQVPELGVVELDIKLTQPEGIGLRTESVFALSGRVNVLAGTYQKPALGGIQLLGGQSGSAHIDLDVRVAYARQPIVIDGETQYSNRHKLQGSVRGSAIDTEFGVFLRNADTSILQVDIEGLSPDSGAGLVFGSGAMHNIWIGTIEDDEPLHILFDSPDVTIPIKRKSRRESARTLEKRSLQTWKNPDFNRIVGNFDRKKVSGPEGSNILDLNRSDHV